MTHLSEEERQGLADGTLSFERAAIASAHLATCDACAADVNRLRAVVRRVSSAPASAADGHTDELWPAIRARIEERKVVPLPVAATTRPGSWLRERRAWMLLSAAAAIVIAAVALQRARTPSPSPTAAATPVPKVLPSSAATVAPASANTRISQEEIQRLLDEVEMQKAMLPPGRAALADSDARAIDQAIAELRDALAHDPDNPALRQLLAEAVQQQGDLIKRMRNGS